MKFPYFLLALAAVGLSSCTGLTGGVIMGADAAGIYATKPDKLPPADTADQIPPHESWCYKTMGEAQCFAHVQNVPPDRLINVDPQNAYPIDVPAYRQALIGKPVVVATEPPAILQPAAAVQVEKAKLKDELVRDDDNGAPALVDPPLAAAP